MLLPVIEGTFLERDEVRDSLRIPDAIQAVLPEASPGPGPTGIVVSNVDRASDLLTPTPGTFAPFLQILNPSDDYSPGTVPTPSIPGASQL